MSPLSSRANRTTTLGAANERFTICTFVSASEAPNEGAEKTAAVGGRTSSVRRENIRVLPTFCRFLYLGVNHNRFERVRKCSEGEPE